MQSFDASCDIFISIQESGHLDHRKSLGEFARFADKVRRAFGRHPLIDMRE
jgi:hypothetical protein